MRRTAPIALVLALAGCGVPPAGNNMLRSTPAADTSPITPMPTAPPMVTPLTAPAVGYGASPPPVPSGGLGAEKPMPAPPASRMPTIAAQPGVPPAGQARRSVRRPVDRGAQRQRHQHDHPSGRHGGDGSDTEMTATREAAAHHRRRQLPAAGLAGRPRSA